MKTKYDFPYQFLDLTNLEYSIVKFDYTDIELSVNIDLTSFEFIDGTEVVIEFESSQTFFRRLFVLNKKKTEVKIKRSEVGNKLDYSIALVAKEEGDIQINDISDYYEIGDWVGILDKNSVIFSEEDGFSSIIKIASTSSDKIAYDLTSNWITIELPKDTYEVFYPWQKDDNTVPFAMSSLGNGCVQFAILEVLRNPEYRSKVWWEVISKMLHDAGYSPEDISEEQVPGATNIILDNCIQKMINAATPNVENMDTSILS
jgi:hypothetical protein